MDSVKEDQWLKFWWGPHHQHKASFIEINSLKPTTECRTWRCYIYRAVVHKGVPNHVAYALDRTKKSVKTQRHENNFGKTAAWSIRWKGHLPPHLRLNWSFCHSHGVKICSIGILLISAVAFTVEPISVQKNFFTFSCNAPNDFSKAND